MSEEYSYELNGAYTEILRLYKLLTEKNIKCDLTRLYDGWRVGVKLDGSEIGDVVEHSYSYGSKLNKLEIMGFGIRDVLGHLTAEQVIEFAETAIVERSANK